MAEDSSEGVYYTRGRVRPEGVYADIVDDGHGGIYADIKDGREPALCGVVSVALLAILAGLIWAAVALM